MKSSDGENSLFCSTDLKYGFKLCHIKFVSSSSSKRPQLPSEGINKDDDKNGSTKIKMI